MTVSFRRDLVAVRSIVESVPPEAARASIEMA
jgi:hypothetical protein